MATVRQFYFHSCDLHGGQLDLPAEVEIHGTATDCGKGEVLRRIA